MPAAPAPTTITDPEKSTMLLSVHDESRLVKRKAQSQDSTDF